MQYVDAVVWFLYQNCTVSKSHYATSMLLVKGIQSIVIYLYIKKWKTNGHGGFPLNPVPLVNHQLFRGNETCHTHRDSQLAAISGS